MLAILVCGLAGCAGVGSLPSLEEAVGQDASADTDGAEGAGSDVLGTGPQAPPVVGAELRLWLESGEYSGWVAESATHQSTGPHFGFVRTFVNNVLLQSLRVGGPEHPEGAAAVKELYGSTEGDVVGYSVMVKIQSESAGGDGWYWYELYDGSTFADSAGNSTCTGCHASGADFFRSPIPFQ